MIMSIQKGSTILFSNDSQTIFVLDTPHSIAQAQTLSSHQLASHAPSNGPSEPAAGEENKHARKTYLLSTAPLEAPYPSTTEPKTDSARAKVLARIPESERVFHAAISPLVQHALGVIREQFESSGGRWCLPRHLDEKISNICVKTDSEIRDSASVSTSKKRPRTDLVYQEDLAHLIKACDASSFYGPELELEAPLILSSTSPNLFSSMSELDTIVKNPSCEPATLSVSPQDETLVSASTEYTIPARSTFILCDLPLSTPTEYERPLGVIPGMSEAQKFNLFLFDPPWPNKSVRRSRHYQTHPYAEMDLLTQRLADILHAHAYGATSPPTISQEPSATQFQTQDSIAAIWITNAEKARRAAYTVLSTSGFHVCEEWIWIKVTATGEPICPVDALWRKPYEILVIGRRDHNVTNQSCSSFHSSSSALNKMQAHADGRGPFGTNSEPDFQTLPPTGKNITRRVIAAVPDIHSRKPNLRELFERIFFQDVVFSPPSSQAQDQNQDRARPYTALEVFARNLTAGWWACGNEVLKFNDRKCWVEE
jgi:N6-adenosine-specific RNA methylase IME4